MEVSQEMVANNVRKSNIRKSAVRRAFTLIELLVVIVVMAVLAAVVIPKFVDSTRRSKETALKSNLALVRNAIASYQADTGYYPSTLADLAASTAPANGLDSAAASKTITATDWHGPYIQGSVPNDTVANAAMTYSTASGSVGKVSSSASGSGLDGNAYSTY